MIYKFGSELKLEELWEDFVKIMNTTHLDIYHFRLIDNMIYMSDVKHRHEITFRLDQITGIISMELNPQIDNDWSKENVHEKLSLELYKIVCLVY